jgi:hypothetical protein
MNRRHHLIRSRWAAIGAAVAVTLGAGGLMTASATSPQSVFVAINPTRILDTRFNVGLTGAFTTSTARELDVTGTITVVLPNGTTGTGTPVPDGATAIALNVTAVQPTALGHVAVRPGGATGEPTTSNININNPGGVWPNAVTVEIGANGNINLYYFGNTPNATTNMIVDIVGYYTTGQGTPGPKGDKGDKGDPGPAGLTFLAQFTSTETNSIGTSSAPPAPADYEYNIETGPGKYYATGALTVTNTDGGSSGDVFCRFHVNGIPITPAYEMTTVDADGYAIIPISATFDIGGAGTGTHYFGMRCYREGGSTAVFYWYEDLTLFKIG